MRYVIMTALIFLVVLTSCSGKDRQTIYPEGHDSDIAFDRAVPPESPYLKRLQSGLKVGFQNIEGIPRKNEYLIYQPECYIYLNYIGEGEETAGDLLYHYQLLKNGTDLNFARVEAEVEIIDKYGTVLRTAFAYPLGNVADRSRLIVRPGDELKLGTTIDTDNNETSIRISAIYVTVVADQ